MTKMERAVRVLETEAECVRRQGSPKCDRKCENCDLLMETSEILEGYQIAIDTLNKIKAEGKTALERKKNLVKIISRERKEKEDGNY